jgi:hypothetical protein
VPAPHYIRPSQAGLLQWFTAIAERSAHPVIVYDIPYRTGVVLELATLRALAAQRIVAIKDCGGDAAKTQALIADGQLQVLAGEDAQIFSTLALGGAGAIAASAHAHTGHFVELMQCLERGDLPAARALWHRSRTSPPALPSPTRPHQGLAGAAGPNAGNAAGAHAAGIGRAGAAAGRDSAAAAAVRRRCCRTQVGIAVQDALHLTVRPLAAPGRGNAARIEFGGHGAVRQAARLQFGEQRLMLLGKGIGRGFALFHGGAQVVCTCAAQAARHAPWLRTRPSRARADRLVHGLVGGHLGQPPVTGGKKATSSPGEGGTGIAHTWFSAMRTALPGQRRRLHRAISCSRSAPTVAAAVAGFRCPCPGLRGWRRNSAR